MLENIFNKFYIKTKKLQGKKCYNCKDFIFFQHHIISSPAKQILKKK